jgi:HK97 family phage major capsid protein
MHDSADNVLGHADLENREDGVYAYCFLNETSAGQNAKELVAHGDINAMSIYANKLIQKGSDVLHGAIREVSLVLSGANPGAKIDTVAIQHSDGFVEEQEDEAIITTGMTIEHGDEASTNDSGSSDDDEDDRTIGDIIETMNDEQKDVLTYLVDQAIGEKQDDENSDPADNVEHSATKEANVKHNVFDSTAVDRGPKLEHSQIKAIFDDAASYGTLSESVMAHAQTYGISNIELLFPDANEINNPPKFIQKEKPWVQAIVGNTKHTPFAKVRATFADISGDDARARGYQKGKLKKEEVFKLIRRETTPQTVYKKQKLDRDDILDITDFDVVSWIKAEMQIKLKEELARAILFGDGRSVASDDKIQEDHIRPILSDDAFYSVKHTISKDTSLADGALIDIVAEAMLDYEGTGNPTFFAHKKVIFDMMHQRDKMGRRLYNTREELANALEVGDIVDVDPMKGLTRTLGASEGGGTANVLGIVVNMGDYNIGTNKGGEVNFFDDFDIDYNQMKYLYETRLSGALVEPYSAVVIEQKTA